MCAGDFLAHDSVCLTINQPLYIFKNMIRNGRLYLLLTLGVFNLPSVFGQVPLTQPAQIIRISGHVQIVSSNNRPGKTNIIHFVALSAANQWSIAATNDHNPKDWAMMRYDGTNIYTLMTQAGIKLPQGISNKFTVYGSVIRGQFYFPEDPDTAQLFLPWMAFHLSPKMIRDSFEHKGVIEMPWPWGYSRFSLGCYGYKWLLQASESDQIIQRIDVVRDKSLDLKTDEDELRRAALDYPFTLAEREEVLHQLRLRKTNPDGFTNTTYECSGLCRTNGFTIPTLTHLSFYWPDYSRPDFKLKGRIILSERWLTVDRVEFLRDGRFPEVIPPEKCFVYDFRYRATNSRTKFNYANYELDSGEQFRPENDPELLAQAAHWLKYGPGYDSHKSKRFLILAGIVVLNALILVGFLFFRLKKHNEQIKKNMKNKTIILSLSLIAMSIIGVKAMNILACSSSNPCGGSCLVYIGGSGAAKAGNCVTAADPTNNWGNYPCDCNITGSTTTTDT
jgi:hypothetical protein